jgi:superfamily II DNA or RNA helicase
MLKTLATQSFPEEFLDGFDLVIWDEAHLCGAPVLSQALGRVRGANLTLTATPGVGVRRRLIELHNGKNWITDNGAEKVPVTAYFVEVPVSDYIKSLDWRFQKIRLSKNKAYSDAAIKHIDSALDAGRRVLVLNSQIQPLAYIGSRFSNSGFVVGSGSLKDIAQRQIEGLYPQEKSWKKKASRYLDRVKTISNPILATGLTKTQPGGVGMDIADLDAGVVMFPVSCPDMTQQLVGRWQRKHKDKKDPIVVVLVPKTPVGLAIAKKMEIKMQALGLKTINRK